jgi:hypothetical protein
MPDRRRGSLPPSIYLPGRKTWGWFEISMTTEVIPPSRATDYQKDEYGKKPDEPVSFDE